MVNTCQNILFVGFCDEHKDRRLEETGNLLSYQTYNTSYCYCRTMVVVLI